MPNKLRHPTYYGITVYCGIQVHAVILLICYYMFRVYFHVSTYWLCSFVCLHIKTFLQSTLRKSQSATTHFRAYWWHYNQVVALQQNLVRGYSSVWLWRWKDMRAIKTAWSRYSRQSTKQGAILIPGTSPSHTTAACCRSVSSHMLTFPHHLSHEAKQVHKYYQG